jgi:hypothetical protein
MTRRTYLLLIVLTCVSLIGGCSGGRNRDYSELGLVDVTGAVKLDGTPLPAATVIFESPQGQRSIGVTDANGFYHLQYSSEESGVTPGEKVVRIYTGVIPDGEYTPIEEDGQTGNDEKLAARYNVESVLGATVTAEQSQTIDFTDLTSK